MSVALPYQVVIRPASSRTGSACTRNQRYCPSDARRMRCSCRNGWPLSIAFWNTARDRSRSSGWIASSHPSPSACASVCPVKSRHRWLHQTVCPLASLSQSRSGTTSAIARSRDSLSRSRRSASRCSVMSTQCSMIVPSPMPAPANSSQARDPSLRRYSFSYGPIRPVSATRRNCSRLISTCSGGVIVRQVSRRPVTSARV